MGFGLDIKQRPIEVSKEDWVEYKGILYPPNQARALKAWDTIREKQEKQSYSREKKNDIRHQIVSIIKNNISKGSNILTLDTEEFLLTNTLKEYNFFICENDFDKYKRMRKNKPSNVKFLHHGNIEELDIYKKDYAVVYLDFCCTFETAKSTIKELFYRLRSSDYFGFTFCLRKNKKKLNDYKFDMIKKIQDFLMKQPMPEYNGCKMNFIYELVYGKAYRDKGHAPMITIFYKNNTKENIIKFLKTLDHDTLWSECKKKGIL